MSDQEAWHELCNLYMMEGDYSKAAFCMEEVLLHNPYSHLIHQRLGDIRYTMGGQDNMEIAKSYYAQAIKLNGNNLRALYGLYLVSSTKLAEFSVFLITISPLSVAATLPPRKLRSTNEKRRKSSRPLLYPRFPNSPTQSHQSPQRVLKSTMTSQHLRQPSEVWMRS